jgi:hypothetical protein
VTLRLHDDLCQAKLNPPGAGRCECAPGQFELYMEVEKHTGEYAYPGIIVSIFRTSRGSIRFVVESTSPGTEGMLHIFNAEQLRPPVRPTATTPSVGTPRPRS